VVDLEREIERVTAKAARWIKYAKGKRDKSIFLRPARLMLKDAADAQKALMSGDDYEKAVALTELMGWVKD